MSEYTYKFLLNTINEYQYLGVKELSNGTKLIGHVPSVGKLAYFHRLYCKLSMDDFSNLEKDLGMKIPDQYKFFLLNISNGLSIFSAAINLYGLRHNYNRTGEDMYQPIHIEDANKLRRIPEASDDVLFIGSYKSDGSKIFIKSDSDTVYRCERYSMNVLHEWDNLEVFLEQECKRLKDHFDSDGNRIDKKRPTTP